MHTSDPQSLRPRTRWANSNQASALSRRLKASTLLVLLSIVLIGSIVAVPLTRLPQVSEPDTDVGNTPTPVGKIGVPFQVSVVAGPTKLLATGANQPNVLHVQIQDLFGNPAYPTAPTTVSLSSSNLLIGAPSPTTVTIFPGQYSGSAGFDTTFTPGTAKVMASAAGLFQGSTIITIVGPAATKLAVSLAPSTVLADGTTYFYSVTVALQNAAGDPVRAPQTIGVSLSSSDTARGTVPTALTISQGQTYAQTHFTSTNTPGTTTITATAAGLTSGQATMTSISVPGTPPASLEVILAPDELPKIQGTYSYPVHVVVKDSSGNPTKNHAGITASLGSSNSTVCTVPASISIPSQQIYQYTSISCGWAPGTATISASAPGLISGSDIVSLVGTNPSKLKVFPALGKLFSDNQAVGNSVAVQIQDSSGQPQWPHTCTTINLASSSSVIGAPSPASVTICPPNTQATVFFDTTYKPGSATITATSGPLTPGTASIKTLGPNPTKLVVLLAPLKLFANSQFHASVITVQLQTGSGSPGRAPQNVAVTLTSGNTAVCNVPSSITIPAGSTYALGSVTTTLTPGNCPITATAANYISGMATLQTVALTTNPPSSISVFVIPKLPPLSPSLFFNDAVTVQLKDASGNPAQIPSGSPSRTISLSTSDPRIGTVTPTSVTISSGGTYAKAHFTATYTLGSTNVMASSPGLPSASAGLTMGVFTPFTKKYQFGSIQYLFYSNTIVVVGDLASSREAMGGSLIADAFARSGMLRPIAKTDALLTSTQLSSSNLVSIGLNNMVTVSKNAAFGIVISENSAWINVTATMEGKTINFAKANYPAQSVGVVYLKQDGPRTTMLAWGYNWQGTYAAALFMEPANWTQSSVATKHLLFLNWTDSNSNGFPESNEITIVDSA